MKSRMIAAVAATALALTTAMTSPVAAGDRDKKVLQLLLGAAAVGLVINEVNKNKRKKKRNAAPVTRSHDEYGYNHDQGYKNGQKGKWRDRNNRRHAVIPSECVFSLRGTRGPREVVSARCMEEFGAARRLPQSCAFEINSGWGSRTVYGARCLSQNGFRIAMAH